MRAGELRGAGCDLRAEATTVLFHMHTRYRWAASEPCSRNVAADGQPRLDNRAWDRGHGGSVTEGRAEEARSSGPARPRPAQRALGRVLVPDPAVCKSLPQSGGRRRERVQVRAVSAPNHVDDGAHEARPAQRGSAGAHSVSFARKCPTLCPNSQAFRFGVFICTQTNACSVTQSSKGKEAGHSQPR